MVPHAHTLNNIAHSKYALLQILHCCVCATIERFSSRSPLPNQKCSLISVRTHARTRERTIIYDYCPHHRHHYYFVCDERLPHTNVHIHSHRRRRRRSHMLVSCGAYSQLYVCRVPLGHTSAQTFIA